MRENLTRIPLLTIFYFFRISSVDFRDKDLKESYRRSSGGRARSGIDHVRVRL